MAGMIDNPTPNRRQRRAAAATGDVAADLKGGNATAPDVTEPPVPPADVVPAPAARSDLPDDAAVLPDATLRAEPGVPVPIVTASPPLAAEASAIDVVQADAAAERVATGAEAPGDRDRAHPAVAGQSMLVTDDRAKIERAREDVAFPASKGVGFAEREATHDGFVVPTLDEIARGLELLAERDPLALDMIRTRFFPDYQLDFVERSDEATVTVIEVVGPEQGRRRAGMTFGPEPRRFLVSDLRADELDAIRSDKQLTVGVSEMGLADANIAFPDTIPAPGA